MRPDDFLGRFSPRQKYGARKICPFHKYFLGHSQQKNAGKHAKYAQKENKFMYEGRSSWKALVQVVAETSPNQV